MKLIKMGLVLTLAVLFIAGCQTPVTLGEMEGNTYSNDYFGLQINKPEDWISVSEEELAGNHTDAIGELNKNLAKQIALEKQKNIDLFDFREYPLSHTEDFNSSIKCAAENITLNGSMQVNTGADYLRHVRNLIIQSGLPYEFGSITSEELGGINFDVIPMDVRMQGLEVKQQFYTTIIKDYALSVIITYTTDSELEALQDILDTMQVTDNK